MSSFVSKLQRTPKVKRVRKKIRELEVKRRALSREYKSAIKVESKKLSRKLKRVCRPKKKTSGKRWHSKRKPIRTRY